MTSSPSSAPHVSGVVVVVPARDEESRITRTLNRVCTSLEHAVATGSVEHARLEVVAHRCSDFTAERAREALARRTTASRVRRDDSSATVGQVRDLAAVRGLADLAVEPANAWVLSTDADTDVGLDWVSDMVGQGRQADAAAVAGLAPLDRWCGGPSGRDAYRRLLASKMRSGDAQSLRQHDHVYGANLGVRADAYLAVGGFSHVLHGEDQALVDALLAAGHRVLRTRSILVRTSARFNGRAAGGLATQLARLDQLGG